MTFKELFNSKITPELILELTRLDMPVKQMDQKELAGSLAKIDSVVIGMKEIENILKFQMNLISMEIQDRRKK